MVCIIIMSFVSSLDDLRRCKKNLKHYYMKRVSQRQSTRWPKLGDPTLYMDVTIIRAQYLFCKTKKDVLERLERRCEEHIMGLVDYEADIYSITIEKILSDGKGEVILIEGDPGSGKTLLTLKICKLWAEEKLLMKEILIWVPLRFFKSATTANELFELFEKLGCPVPGMKEYAQQNNGEGLVLILDGWDELPNQLQTESLFSDIVFGKSGIFLNSTIVVTSRPTCSGDIAESVEGRKTYYQILGFSPQSAFNYIEQYFHDDRQSAELLLAFIEGREYFRRHFYIPITVAIMCFVYSHSEDGEMPKTLSKLYENFVLLYIRSNVSSKCCPEIRKVSTLKNIPQKLKPLFNKLCKTAFTLLKHHKLVFDEDELEIAVEDLDNVDLKHFDGFGLLYIDHYTSSLATREKSYSFIHRAVQELLAAIYILDTGNISDILDEYFYEGTYLINVFPFLFGLVSKELLKPLAGKLIEIFFKFDNNTCKFLLSILYCLFETQDKMLCHEFGRVFSENKKGVNLCLRTLLECHYAYYFISACGGKKLKVTMLHNFELPGDLCLDIMVKYLYNTSTDIAYFGCGIFTLSHRGMEQLAKVLSTQCNVLTVKIESNRCDPGCVTILCDSIHKYNRQITSLILPRATLSKKDLENVGFILTTCLSLKCLHMGYCSPDEGVYLKLTNSFCKAVRVTKSLQTLWLSKWNMSQADSQAFGDIISQNCSLKELCINVATADCLDPILNGLSSNTSITTFRVWPAAGKNGSSTSSILENCFTLNHSLRILDFTYVYYELTNHFGNKYVPWSSTQVCSICTGLCANTTVVTLDISGCYINTEACHAVCGMLSQNTTLQHLFLNPVHLEKQEAITMIESCRDNTTLELLSLVQWPPKKRDSLRLTDEEKDPFHFSTDQEIEDMLLRVQTLREQKTKPLLNIYWLVQAIRCVHRAVANLVCTQ